MQRFTGKGHLLQKWDTCRTAFMCCDVQDRIRPYIANFQAAVDVSNSMSQVQQLIGDKHSVFLATEQYPNGIGPIAKDIKLPPTAPKPFPKVTPSMLTPELLPYIMGDESRGIEPVQQAILWGHETQICVMNTADDLLSRGIRVCLVTEGCACQNPDDHFAAMLTMSGWPGLSMCGTLGAMMQLSKSDPVHMKPFLKIAKQITDMANARKQQVSVKAF